MARFHLGSINNPPTDTQHGKENFSPARDHREIGFVVGKRAPLHLRGEQGRQQDRNPEGGGRHVQRGSQGSEHDDHALQDEKPQHAPGSDPRQGFALQEGDRDFSRRRDHQLLRRSLINQNFRYTGPLPSNSRGYAENSQSIK